MKWDTFNNGFWGRRLNFGVSQEAGGPVWEGILAPVVYHQEHMHHPVVRRERHERVVRIGDGGGGGGDQQQQQQHDDHLGTAGGGHDGHDEHAYEDDGHRSSGGGGGGGRCDAEHGFTSGGGGDGKCASCLALWHGPNCDDGDVFSMPKGDDAKRSRRLPAQFTGDVLMNKQQLAASGPDIKVHLPAWLHHTPPPPFSDAA